MNRVDRKLIINAGFALALTILTAIGWLSYKEMTSMVVSEALERQAHTEILELVDLLSKLREVESMNRGFIITGDEKYLEPYKAARSVIEQKMVHLRELEQAPPRQLKRLDGIIPLISEKLLMVETTINLRRAKGFQPASQAVMTGRGKWLMDEIGRQVAASQDEEGRILQEQETEDVADTRKAIRLLLAGNTLSLALLCTVFILLRKEIDRGIGSEDELRKHRDHLDHLVLERTAQLVQAKLEAETANNAKSEFLENISHEMRTPLTGVMGVIDLLLTNARTDEERHYLEMAKTSANSLKWLINDSIDFARNANGEMSFTMRPFNLRDCTREAAEVFEMEVNRKGLRCVVEIDDEVPEMVAGDEGRLRQVLVNLVGNAVKFTEQGEIHVSVRSNSDPARTGPDILLFAVRDTGCGIAAEYLDTIFEKFTQADASSTRKHGGAGLGLALAGQIVENMGGKIRVESRIGEGSVFSFTIPFVRPAQ